MKKRTFFTALLSLLLAKAALADAPQTLTWADCVQLASRNNPTLQSALAAVQSNQAAYKGSFNGLLPHLSFSNSYSDSNAANLGESKQWTLTGNASLDLLDLNQWASIDTASALLKQSRANLEVASNNALLSLYQAFAALLYAQQEVAVDTNIRDTWKTDAQMVALRYDSGAESKGDNMNTQAQLTQADANLVQASRDVLVAQQQLSQSIGYDNFNNLIVTGTWTASDVPSPEPDFNALLAKEPAIQLQDAVMEQARDAIKSAHSALWPTVSLNYSQGTQGTSEFPRSNFWSFSGVASYPLFGNGLTSTYYATQVAERNLEKAQQDMRTIRNQTLSTLVSAWTGFGQAHDQVNVEQAFLDAGRQRKQESDVLYQSGLQSFQDWNQIVTQYVNTQVAFLKAEQSLLLAEAQWRFAVGQQLGE